MRTDGGGGVSGSAGDTWAVAYGNSTFVAVGEKGILLTSP